MAKEKRRSFLPTAASSNPEWLWKDEAFAERCPALYEFLALGIVDEEPRKGGSITLFVSQQALKVCFLDKTTQMNFYALVEPEGDLWAFLEGLLAGEHPPWEPTKHGRGGVPGF